MGAGSARQGAEGASSCTYGMLHLCCEVLVAVGDIMPRTFKWRNARPEKESYFDRQQLIPWWDQQIISNAKVMIVGAGALGNETIKNLVLLGFRNLIICDLDNIEISNLSRTILFGPTDIGKSKAETAAARARRLCLSKDNSIHAFHGDITSHLGLGIFLDVDIVLGCVDNVEARRFINRACRLVQRPWIDTGINGLSGHIAFYDPNSSVCYECGLTDHQLAMSQLRYSCDNVKREFIQQERVPTVQVTSSIISGLQTQECVKYLCSRAVAFGKSIYFDGLRNELEIFTLQARDDCEVHAYFDKIVSLEISNKSKVRDVLCYLAANEFGPMPAITDLLGIRQFVRHADCRICGSQISLYRPLCSLTERDLICDSPHANTGGGPKNDELQVSKQLVHSFDLFTTEPRILDMTLADVGIPSNDILCVQVAENDYRYARLCNSRV
jgi:molybdopterin-synthase adenylyltransferase